MAPGCWTCRVRHRKCDLETPSCKECADRHVHCHGYGPKPAWMDGGLEEKKEKSRIKAAVKENFCHVKKMQGRARRRANELSRSSFKTPTPTPTHEERLPNTVITPSSPSCSPRRATTSEPHFDSENNVQSCSPDNVEPPTPPSPRPLDNYGTIDPQEAWLLMHYLDQVFPWQFPYHDPRSRLGNRGWLFLLLIKRGPLYHAALSLSSLLQSAILETEEEFQRKQRALDHHSRALRELCDLMSEKGDKLREDHGELAEFLTCSFMLISFEVREAYSFFYASKQAANTTVQVFSGAEHDWLVHLDAAASVMSLLSAEAIFSPKLSDTNNHLSPLVENPRPEKGGINDGLKFLMVTVIWFDLFACLPTGRAPRLPYQRWLQIPGLNTADLMGCQNWVMIAIGDLANFAIWKDVQERDGVLSIRELASKAEEIERRLEDGIQSLDLARSVS
ncbi:C6 transcription factor [Penicillium argentinense]|uniref:C6 transcription factor n=1 Tax=Penicillium argentinense TaxID=1131581 RepID=A0A9W9JYH3_9EURO|nr:C6 transcription factor [Penicillium argentinense]KAJ5086041.1 C6 transcription factor [Penicillium argentinense]